MRWYAVLFWIWVVVSLAIFVYRRLTGAGRTEAPTEPESSPLDRQWGPTPTDPDSPDAASTDEHVAAASTGERAASSDRASSDGESGGADRPEGPITLGDLLSGITLPHGLVPLTQAAPGSGPITSIVVATDTAPPEQVAPALADEIERLGYEVRSTGEHTALAEGPRGALEIEVHPDSSTAVDGGALRFPTAPPHSVVVELRVARGSGGR